MITPLRVMLILIYCPVEIQFSWWLWLYALIIELDSIGMQFLQYRALRFNDIQISKLEAEENNVGGKSGSI